MDRIELSKNDKILVVAPHPDDESIGCGGLLAKYGIYADVLLVTDGRKGHQFNITDEECVLLRDKEFDSAMSQVNPLSTIKLQIPDTEISNHKKKIGSMKKFVG